MTDIVSQEKRKQMMAGIRSRDTGPEKRVRSLLHRMGMRFRLHSKKLPGHPDIVLPRLRTVIMVHGCFWHRHEGCRYAYAPKTRKEFWEAKFRANVARDINVRAQLEILGWKVGVIWECETHDARILAGQIDRILFRT